MKHKISKTCDHSGARLGQLTTKMGTVETPVFMPVGTAGAVKAMLHKELLDFDAEIILGNTYHLFLRPGMEVIDSFGSLHKFIGWDRSILTDSGGFQIFSLQGNSRVSEKGVAFKSHIDGSSIFFSPEDVVSVQNSLNSDIQMVLDYFAGYPATRKEDYEALNITEKWARRAREEFLKGPGENAQFGIVQGGGYTRTCGRNRWPGSSPVILKDMLLAV